MMNHRMVLYTEGMEPITVLELPSAALEYLSRHDRYRLPVPEPLTFSLSRSDYEYKRLRVVELWVEKFIRNGSPHWFLFTSDDENALLLKAAFLPGQRNEINDQKAGAYARGFIEALCKLGFGND